MGLVETWSLAGLARTLGPKRKTPGLLPLCCINVEAENYFKTIVEL